MDEYIKEMEKQLKFIDNDIEMIHKLNEVSSKLINVDINRAVDLSEKAYELSYKHDYKRGMAYSLKNKGICYSYTSNFKDASLFLFESLNIFTEYGDRIGEASVKSSIGGLFYKIGNYSSALDYHLKSLRITEVINDKRGQAKALNNIALVFNKLGEYNRALIYHMKSLKIEEDINNIAGQAYTKNNVGNIYMFLKNYRQALKYFSESLQIAEQINDNHLLGTVLGNIGEVYEEKEEYKESLDYYKKALDKVKELGNKHLEASLLKITGRLYIKKKNIEKAFENLKKAYKLAKEISSENLIYEIHKHYSEAYEVNGDYQKALEEYKIFHKYEKEVLNEDLNVRTKNILIQFEVEKIQRIAENYKQHNIKLSKANKSLKERNQLKSMLVKKLRKQTRILEKQVNHDFLTGLYNRGYIEERLREEYERSKRHKDSLSMALCDIDHFKEINDDFSHAVGDKVLEEISHIFKDNCRSIDIIGRYGGDEFILIFPKTNLTQSNIVCERVRYSVENYDWKSIATGLKVTVSLGISDDSQADSPEQMFANSDARLYEAKNSGRNNIKS
jgi:diguanylate cyclase (GGDEF)-like protein